MPTPLKDSRNMKKHLTKAERKARESAEAGMRRTGRVRITAPAWLGDDARKVFESTKRKLRDLDLLDPADVHMLALYSDAIVKYQEAVKILTPGDPKHAQAAQAWSRLALSFAEKMGISATGRARLARKKAERAAPDELEQLLDGAFVDDVNDFLNGDQGHGQ